MSVVLTRKWRSIHQLFFACFLCVFSSNSYATDSAPTNVQAAINQSGVGKQTHAFYKKNNFRPIWINNESWNQCAEEAIDRLTHAEREGLEPNSYKKGLGSTLKAFENNDFYRAELLLTNVFLRYIDDVRNGRFNPRLADRQLVVSQILLIRSKFYIAAVRINRVSG